jgi:LPS sulfotransferase NodH
MQLQLPPPDWRSPGVALFIAGAQRCGSTLLCNSLRKTMLLGIPTEFFVNHGPTPAACHVARRDGSTSNDVMAASIFWDQFDRLRSAIAFDLWFQDQRWILLRRRDVLGQAISLAIALQTDQWSSRRDASRPPSYSRAFIDRCLASTKAAYLLWNHYFAAAGLEPLQLWYEDVADDPHAAVARIAAFVGGDALEREVRLSSPFASGDFDVALQRQRSSLNEEWRRRYSRA